MEERNNKGLEVGLGVDLDNLDELMDGLDDADFGEDDGIEGEGDFNIEEDEFNGGQHSDVTDIEPDIENMTAEQLEAYMAKAGIDIDEDIDVGLGIEADKSEEYETLVVEGAKQDSLGADNDGSILDSDLLLTDSFDLVDEDADFISDTGKIVVMEDSENGENFRLQYIDIENIAIVKRIRKSTTNVEDLVQSIKSTGLLEPLVVAPTATEGTYVLLAGFRRIMACARVGKRKIPCIVNIKANVPEIPVLEAMYNHNKSYTIREIVDYIEYLEKQKGIMSASMIEYLLQMNSGDYTKLKDILNDNDDDIVTKLFDGIYNIDMAFKKLEQRRKKESAEEKDNKKAAKVYEDEAESGAANLAGSGEETDGEALSEEEIQSLAFSAKELEDVDDESLDELRQEAEDIEGFAANTQDYRNRTILDPTLRKSVLARDKDTCQICKVNGGQEFTEVLDVHHIIEVYLGGSDNIENLITACTVCHKLVHLYGRGELNIRPMDELSESEQARFKRIVKLGTVIRKGLKAKGMKREQLKKIDGAATIGRTKPGTGQQTT